MGNMNNTNQSDFIPEIWSKEALDFMEKNRIVAGLVNRLDSDVLEGGKSVKVPVLGNLVANDKTPGSQVTTQNPNSDGVLVSINKHKEVSILVEDLTEIQSNPKVRELYTQNMAEVLWKAVDKDILALYLDFTQAVGTYGSDLDEATILEAKTFIDKAGAPMEGRVMFVSATQYNSLLKIARFTEADKISGAGEQIAKGMLGRIHGFDVYMNNQVIETVDETDPENPINETHNVVFQKMGISCAVQLTPRVQADYSLKDLGWLVVADIIYGVKVSNVKYCVELKS